MKYIIFEDFSGHPVPFIFPHRVDHADMREQLPLHARALRGLRGHGGRRVPLPRRRAGIAGSARPEDAAVIAAKFAPRLPGEADIA